MRKIQKVAIGFLLVLIPMVFGAAFVYFTNDQEEVDLPSSSQSQIYTNILGQTHHQGFDGPFVSGLGDEYVWVTGQLVDINQGLTGSNTFVLKVNTDGKVTDIKINLGYEDYNFGRITYVYDETQPLSIGSKITTLHETTTPKEVANLYKKHIGKIVRVSIFTSFKPSDEDCNDNCKRLRSELEKYSETNGILKTYSGSNNVNILKDLDGKTLGMPMSVTVSND